MLKNRFTKLLVIATVFTMPVIARAQAGDAYDELDTALTGASGAVSGAIPTIATIAVAFVGVKILKRVLARI